MPREVVIMRRFQAPRELVFKAWTDPENIGKWWGPTGFTTTTHHRDVRTGGSWRYVMHGPDGVDYDNLIEYVEIASPNRLVYKHGTGAENDPHQFHVTVTFAEVDGQTNLTLRTLFNTAEQRKMVVEQFGAIEGGKQTLNRLAEYLEHNA
ncbi:ATPase [Paenibacillus swuensis]|uniref:ATPase n=2 Tax=Paenibacillus swuensis TaxID=1178515 RepID=A0A172TPJ8_9BACL|nr:ATPase [Paenibacillus swuensis]